MGLRDKIQSKVAAAFSRQLADAVSAFSGVREVVGEYDPATGTTPAETIHYTGRGVFGGYSTLEIDEQHILSSDTKLTVLQSELLQGGQPFLPQVGDEIDGMRVERVGQDPAGATWSLQCRGTRIPALLNDWLLYSGVWDDSGTWSDAEAWSDGDVVNWALLSGIWNDSGEWHDNQEWNDGQHQ